MENFWIILDSTYLNSYNLQENFNNFFNNFNRIYVKRDNRLNRLLNIHHCGLENYLKYSSYSKFFNENGIHVPDCKIISDAHDLGLIMNPLAFLTYDKNLLDAIEKLNLSFLEIHEFKSINY